MAKAMRGLLLITASVWFLFSLLAVFRAPFYFAWKLAIVATERGYWIAPAGLLFLIGWRGGRVLRAAAMLGVVSTVLLLSPVLRAARFDGFDALTLLRRASPERITPRRLHYRIVPGDSLPIDYYAPRPAGRRAPLVVMIHGGSWRGGHPGELAGLNHLLADRGYAVAAITYRFAPAHHHPVQLRDIRSAIAQLRSRAVSLGFDPNAIVLIGRSAGGHLALLAAYERPDPAFKAVVSFYGPTDLIWGYDHPAPRLVHDTRGILADFVDGTPSDRAAAYRDASPLSYISNAPPTLLIHGTRDELVNVQHSRRLAAALRATGKTVTYIELPWATHACDYFLTGPCGQISTQHTLVFLEQVLTDRR